MSSKHKVKESNLNRLNVGDQFSWWACKKYFPKYVVVYKSKSAILYKKIGTEDHGSYDVNDSGWYQDVDIYMKKQMS